jgi:hypothetical protein
MTVRLIRCESSCRLHLRHRSHRLRLLIPWALLGLLGLLALLGQWNRSRPLILSHLWRLAGRSGS